MENVRNLSEPAVSQRRRVHLMPLTSICLYLMSHSMVGLVEASSKWSSTKRTKSEDLPTPDWPTTMSLSLVLVWLAGEIVRFIL